MFNPDNPMDNNPENLRQQGFQEQSLSESPERVLETPYKPYIEQAKAEGRWVVLPDVGKIPDGSVRLFRGVAPEGIEGEFGEPISPEEDGELGDIVRDIVVKPLSPERTARMQELIVKKHNIADKFYTDDHAVARGYAHDSVVYYLDTDPKNARKWHVLEGTKKENAFAVPNDVSREKAEVFAVGKDAPLDIDIRPEIKPE